MLCRWPLLAALLALHMSVGVGLAAGAEAPSDARILLNQKRMEIRQLIELVSKETGRTILFDEQVRGVVSLVSKRPVTPNEAWEILGSALHMLGYSLLPSTVDQWRIARVAEAVGESPFVAAPRRESDLFVTALIPLEQGSLPSVMNVLQPLAGAGVTLVALRETNSMIASGPERAIARLTVIADELDRVEERTLRQRVLRYREVVDVEQMIQMQFDGGSFSDRDLEIWSDERTNSLIFRGEDETVERLIAFLEKIDEPVEGEGEIRVLRVLNRDASDIAQILGGQAPAGARSRTKTKNGGDSARENEQDDADKTRSSDGEDPQDNEDERQNQPNAAPADPSVPEQSSARGAGGVGGAGGGLPIDLKTLLGGEDYSIAVDEPTRSLVVRASERGHDLIRELVEELDAPPQLIAVDITISELRTPTDWALALSYNVPLLPGDSLDELIGRLVSLPAGGGFGTAPIGEGALFGRVTRDSGIVFEVPGENGPVQVPLEDTGVIDAIDRKAINEILIQPSLVVIAGEEHEIFVGDNIPIPVSESTPSENLQGGAGGTPVLSNTIRFDRQDVGVRINIEVQAGKEGPIVLQLETEISSLAPSVAGDVTKVGPTLINQVVSAKARLDDGETAIIGVDRERVEVVGQGGTPWLADIPMLGWLFKARGKQVRDVRLIIAARARRISTPAEFAADTIRRRLAFERQSAREEHLPEAEGSPYGVRVTTRTLEADADAIAQDLERKGHRTTIHGWQSADRRDLFDVYVMGLESMSDAGDLAYRLAEDGWDADLVVFSPES